MALWDGNSAHPWKIVFPTPKESSWTLSSFPKGQGTEEKEGTGRKSRAWWGMESLPVFFPFIFLGNDPRAWKKAWMYIFQPRRTWVEFGRLVKWSSGLELMLLLQRIRFWFPLSTSDGHRCLNSSLRELWYLLLLEVPKLMLVHTNMRTEACALHTHLKIRVKDKSGRAVVVHTFNPSTWEAEAGRFLSSRPAWSTKWAPGHPELYRKTLSRKTKKKKKKKDS